MEIIDETVQPQKLRMEIVFGCFMLGGMTCRWPLYSGTLGIGFTSLKCKINYV